MTFFNLKNCLGYGYVVIDSIGETPTMTDNFSLETSDAMPLPHWLHTEVWSSVYTMAVNSARKVIHLLIGFVFNPAGCLDTLLTRIAWQGETV